MENIKLTQYSHGAGCGCKISPKILDEILHTSFSMPDNDRLIVGNHIILAELHPPMPSAMCMQWGAILSWRLLF